MVERKMVRGVSRDLQFAISDLRFAICDLRFAIPRSCVSCDLQFAISDLRFRGYVYLTLACSGLKKRGSRLSTRNRPSRLRVTRSRLVVRYPSSASPVSSSRKRPSEEERMIREFVLQLKLGAVRPDYFERKYGVDVLEEFRHALDALASERLLTASRDLVALSREGLLRVDSFLPRFFLPQHMGLRYT